MAILNYTTKVKSATTVGQMQRMLVKFGAREISIGYEGGEPSDLRFVLDISRPEGFDIPVPFRLPSDVAGVEAALISANVARRYRTVEHARSVAWRILKDWLEAQLAIIEAGLARPEQVLLPYAIATDGRTFYEHFDANPQQLLASGGGEP